MSLLLKIGKLVVITIIILLIVILLTFSEDGQTFKSFENFISCVNKYASEQGYAIILAHIKKSKPKIMQKYSLYTIEKERSESFKAKKDIIPIAKQINVHFL